MSPSEEVHKTNPSSLGFDLMVHRDTYVTTYNLYDFRFLDSGYLDQWDMSSFLTIPFDSNKSSLQLSNCLFISLLRRIILRFKLLLFVVESTPYITSQCSWIVTF